MYIDSHCHLDRLDLAPWGGAFSQYVASARAEGLEAMLCVSIDLHTWPALRSLIEPYPEIHISVGIHPNEAPEESPSGVALYDALVAHAADPRVVAIGETGLDYFRTEAGAAWQVERFLTHIEAAKALGKPLIIHTREAREDTMRLLEAHDAAACGGVMHCFSEDWDTARRALDIGFYVSFSGILTYKSAESLREVARRLPLERVLTETDAPYLAPVPHRGKPNYPHYVREVTRLLATLHGMQEQVMAAQVEANYRRLFRL